MTHDSDMELVTRALQGDAAAFGTLVERYQQAVHAVCVSILHDFDLAQDLTQEAFLKALQHLHHLVIPDRFGNWLRIIAVNECRLFGIFRGGDFLSKQRVTVHAKVRSRPEVASHTKYSRCKPL